MAALVCWLAAGLGSLALLTGLTVDTSTSSILDTSSAEWVRYLESVRQFGSDEVVLAVVDTDETDAGEIVQVSGRLLQIDGVDRVESLASSSLLISRGKDVVFGPPLTTMDLAAAVEAARQKPHLVGSVVSGDGRAIAWVVVPHESLRDYERLVDEIRAALPPHASISGVPVFRTEANRYTRSELQQLLPVSLGLLLGLGWVVHRRFSLAVIALIPGCAGILVVGAAMALADVSLTFVTMILPPTFLALGVAYSVHPIYAMRAPDGTHGMESQAAANGLSGITTALGVLSAAVVPIPAVREIGLFGALGIGVTSAASLSVVPACLRLVSAEALIENRHVKAPEWLFRQKPSPTVLVWLVALTLASVGLFRAKIETDPTRWFAPESRVNREHRAVLGSMAGISPMNFVVSRSDGGAMTSGRAVAELGAFSAFLRDEMGIEHVHSVADVVDDLAGAFESSASSETELPQLLLLAESEPSLRSVLSADHLTANTSVRMRDNSSLELLRVASRGVSWWGDRGDYDASATGIMYEFARAEDAIAWGQIASICIAVALIGAVIAFVVGVRMLALVVLVGNVAPIVGILGAMGWFGVPLDAASVMLGSLALGIAVDDSFHLVGAFLCEEAIGASEPVSGALAHIFPAIMTSSAVIAAGFSVLLLSEFALVTSLGALTIAAVLLCFAADVTLLPMAIKMTSTSGARTD